MQAGGGAFSRCVKVADVVPPVLIHLDPAADIMCRRDHRDHIPGDVDPDAQTFRIDGREMADQLVLFKMAAVEVDVIVPGKLHLVVDGAGHDIPRCQGEPGIIFMHELLAVLGPQGGPKSPYRFRDQERRTFGRIIEGGGVELDELHILHGTFGTVYHRDPVARGDRGVGCGGCIPALRRPLRPASLSPGSC